MPRLDDAAFFLEVIVDDTLTFLELIGLIALIMLYFLHNKVDKIGSRMTEIENALGIETELKRAAKVDADVEAKIKEGKINQAIKLHRARHQISGKEAEEIIKRHAASMT